jgi:hypothetical protein
MKGSYSPVVKKFSTRRAHAAFFAVLLLALGSFGALAVDIGLVRVARAQLQTALDAAALSGATELDGTAHGILAAERRVLEYASYNEVLRKGVELDPTDVEIGTWDVHAGAFSVWAPGDDPRTVNAVRVSHTVPAISAVLASVAFGIGGFQVEASSVALRAQSDRLALRSLRSR